MAESLFYLEFGEGIVVICLHAYALDHRIWVSVADMLKRKAHVILPDLRGHGRSPAPEGKYSMRGMAEDILRIMDEHSIEQAVLVGNSMGGYVSLAFAKYFPDRLAGLALVASHVYADPDEKKAARMADMDRLRHMSPADVLPAMPRKLSKYPQVIKFCQECIAEANPTGLIGTLAAMADRKDMADLFQRMTMPTLIIAGLEDQFIPIELSREMAKLMAKPNLVEIPEAGHLPMLDKPQQTYQALYDFIAPKQRLKHNEI